jgi:hypothetical protein
MNTRSVLLALFIVVFITTSSHAQSGMSIENWSDIKVGPMFTAGLSLNAGNVESDTKTGTRFAFTGGALGMFPFSSHISLLLGLAYDDRGVNYHLQNDANTYVNYSFSYLSLQPMIDLGGFMIGLGFGLPMGASASPSSGRNDPTPSTSNMNFMVEGRIGGAIPIIESDQGQLQLLISAAYPFTNIQKNIGFFGSTDATHNNGSLATGQIGLTYLFDLTPH